MTPGSGCPCGSGLPAHACCDQFIQGNAVPRTAEELMRSRYTAYVYRQEGYLLATWHETTRPAKLELGSGGPVRWLGLQVLRTEQGGPADREGRVEFIARYKPSGRAGRLHETSRFRREGDRWFYVDGEITP